MNEQLIELNEIIDVCEKLVERVSYCGYAQSGDDLYEEYKKRIDAFDTKYDLKNHPSQIIRFKRALIQNFYWKCGYTVNLDEAKYILEFVTSLKLALFPKMFEKIFISHCEKDKEQVSAFVDLLHTIGIPRPFQNCERTIFCSSHPAAYIENGRMIDEEILKQFHCKGNVYFILWYTDNYFKSQACLNEMGAVWVTGKTYQEILMPSFERNKIGGLLPKSKINFKANEKLRLNTFKSQVEEMFNLYPIDQNAWEIARDNFINQIEAMDKEK